MTRLEREINKIAKRNPNYPNYEEVFINAINLSVKEIEWLKFAIISDRLRVTPDIVDKVMPEYLNDFLDGKRIYPQQNYIVMACNFPFNREEENYVLAEC